MAQPVRCDVGRIQQVASNILANALTHGADHSEVKVSASVIADDFVLEVWNDGIPISDAEREHMFKPFWRHSVSSLRQGLGLGLYISAQLVKAHAGTISVASAALAGTRFTVRIPVGRP